MKYVHDGNELLHLYASQAIDSFITHFTIVITNTIQYSKYINQLISNVPYRRNQKLSSIIYNF